MLLPVLPLFEQTVLPPLELPIAVVLARVATYSQSYHIPLQLPRHESAQAAAKEAQNGAIVGRVQKQHEDVYFFAAPLDNPPSSMPLTQLCAHGCAALFALRN